MRGRRGEGDAVWGEMRGGRGGGEGGSSLAMQAENEESRSVCLEGDCVQVSSVFTLWFLSVCVCVSDCVKKRRRQMHKRELALANTAQEE